MTRLLALLLALSPALVLAQAPRLDAIPDGGQVVYRLPNGAALATFTVRINADGTYVMEHRPEDRLDGPPQETHLYSADGNILKRRFADGVEMTYRPHNCVRTPGTCRYTAVFASGGTRDYERVNTALPDGAIRSRLYSLGEDGARRLKQEFFYTFAEDGLLQRAERRDANGAVLWAREATRLWDAPRP